MKIPYIWNSGDPPVPVSYASEFRDFLHKHTPADFETKFRKARPFVFSSFIAWPMFWLYKGLDWGRRRHIDRSLTNYINKTFLQAKMLQIGIIATGIFVAMNEDSQFLQNINNTFTFANEPEIEDEDTELRDEKMN